MTYPSLALVFEIMGFLAFFIILAREIYQGNRLRVFEIISCAVFGMILEIGDIYLGQAYSYGPDFFVKIAGVPIVIGLGWASIIYCAMLLSDQYHIPWKLRPFMDALTAIILDLAIDAVAIRIGLWHWAIPLDQEFYGVPYENLIGWVLVVLAFSFLIRFIRTLNPKRQMTKILMWLSPAVAYVLLLAGMIVFGLVTFLPYQINNISNRLAFSLHPDLSALYNPQVQQWKLAIFMVILIELVNIVVWAIIKHRRKYLWRFDLLSYVIMAVLHLFFLSAVYFTDIHRQMPILGAVGLLMFALYNLLHFLPYLLRPGTVYIFKDAEKLIAKEERVVERAIEASFK